jgi:hypothetical protein
MKTCTTQCCASRASLDTRRPLRWAVVLGTIVLATLATTPATGHASTTLHDAEVAIRVRDFSLAAGILAPLAERGDPRAQLLLAGLYRVGNGVSKDRGVAFEYAKTGPTRGAAPRAASCPASGPCERDVPCGLT